LRGAVPASPKDRFFKPPARFIKSLARFLVLVLLLAGGPHPAAGSGNPDQADPLTRVPRDKTMAITDAGSVANPGGAPTITLDVRRADLRDVLSALAIKMGVSMVLVEEAAEPVTFSAKDTTPSQAFELILQTRGLSYLREGNIIVIAKPDALQKDFFNQMILTRFNLLFITTDHVKPLIQELGIPLSSISVGTNPQVLWAQGTPQALHKLRELLQAVDRLENVSSLQYRTLTATQVSPTRLQELLSEAGVDIPQSVALGNRLLVFDRALHNRWGQVEALAGALDTLDARERTVFVYQLKNISAADAVSRLAAFGFEGVATQTFNYPEISQEILVICPPHLQNQVRSALAGIDGTRLKVRVPVASTTGVHAHEAANARRHLLSELTGVPIGNFHISRNLSGDPANPHYVLWVEESPEKIRQIEELAGKL
jgi:type IV pilus assembly protein PilQ